MGIAMLLESIASTVPERPLVGARDGALSAGDLLAQAGGGAAVLRDAGADAALVAGIVHRRITTVADIKQTIMRAGINVRATTIETLTT